MPVKNTDNRIVKDKVIIINKTNYIINIKTRIIIIGYYKQKVLSKILYLQTIKE